MQRVADDAAREKGSWRGWGNWVVGAVRCFFSIFLVSHSNAIYHPETMHGHTKREIHVECRPV